MPINPPILIVLCKVIYTFHMPVFISISGYLFYYTIVEKKCNILLNEYIKKKTKRLLIPFVIVLMFWVVPIKNFIRYYKLVGCNDLLEILLYVFINMDFGHLWYLPVLFILDILMFAFYKKIEAYCRKNNIFKYAFILLLAVCSIFYYIPSQKLYIVGKIFKLAFFYYLGYLIRKSEINGASIYRHSLFCFAILIDLLSLMFKQYISSRILISISFTEFLVFLFNFIVGVASTYVLYFITNKFQRFANLEIVKYINKESMHIYLFHEPLIYIVIYLFNAYSIDSPYLFLIISLISCLGISIFVAHTISSLSLGFIIGDKKIL